MFRLEVQVDHVIRADVVQDALWDVLPRFPYFHAEIRPGLFWYMLVRRRDFPRVQADVANPCMDHRIMGKGVWPFRVRIFNDHIAVEFSHMLTDGMGAQEFLQALVTRYFQRLDGDDQVQDLVTHPLEDPWEDPSPGLALKRVPLPPPLDRSLTLPFPLMKPGEYHVLHAFMPTDQVLRLAKECGVSLTEYLTAVFMSVIQERLPRWIRKRQVRNPGPIRILIPINLRPYFNRRTLRNFFAFAHPEIDPRLGEYSFEEICSTVMYTLRRQTQQAHLMQQMSRNVNEERAVYKRLAPLFLKNLAIQMVFRQRGDKLYTGSVSNLGKVVLPEPLVSRVRSWSFIAPPNPVQKVNMNLVSLGNKLCVTFTSMSADTSIMAGVIRFLTARGVPVHVESNTHLLEARQ